MPGSTLSGAAGMTDKSPDMEAELRHVERDLRSLRLFDRINDGKAEMNRRGAETQRQSDARPLIADRARPGRRKMHVLFFGPETNGEAILRRRSGAANYRSQGSSVRTLSLNRTLLIHALIASK